MTIIYRILAIVHGRKRFANFANLEAFANVFLHFLSWLEFLYSVSDLLSTGTYYRPPYFFDYFHFFSLFKHVDFWIVLEYFV